MLSKNKFYSCFEKFLTCKISTSCTANLFLRFICLYAKHDRIILYTLYLAQNFTSKQQSLHGILSGNYMQINSCFNSNLKYRVNEKIMFALNNCDIIFITLFRGIKAFVLVMRFEILW